jgi:hypothetical protein
VYCAVLPHACVCTGLDVVAGSTAGCWGVGSRPSTRQQQRFTAACKLLTQALQESGGPYLTGDQPSLVSSQRKSYYHGVCDSSVAMAPRGACWTALQT